MPVPLTPADGILTGEAVSDLSTATYLFANAPAGLKGIILTIRGAPVTMRFDGGVPTFDANGHTYDPGRYEFEIGTSIARQTQAIDEAGASSVWVTYVV